MPSRPSPSKVALDTNAYKALGDGEPNVAQATRHAEEIGLPVVVLGELLFGFINGSRLSENSESLRRFLATPRVRVLELDTQTARLFGETATLLRRAGVAIQQNDIWIAALCKQHGFVLASRDKGFRHVLGLELLEVSSSGEVEPSEVTVRRLRDGGA
jgi:tRNA(fMet)-specific endonuclease VapC